MPKLLNDSSLYCLECRGKCWSSDDPFKTQKNVQKLFGVIPNNCVNDANGTIHCPFAKNK